MAELTCEGVRVLEATVHVPRVGAWHADLVLDGPAPAGAATVRDATGAALLVGTVARGGDADARGGVRLVGGGGGFARELGPRFYRNAPARLPLGDVLREAGETLSPTATGLDAVLPYWARARGRAATALDHLLDALGLTRRVLLDGTTWVGAEAWPAVDVRHELLGDDPREDAVTIATEALPVALGPGTTFRGRRVSHVVHAVGGRSRTTVWFERPDAPGDRAGAPLEALVRHTMRAVDYLASYRARVVAQAADGTLDLQPDDARLPGLTGVPIRYGIPGVRATVAAGAYALVEFEAGNPARPVATLWESGAVTELRLEATNIVLNGGALKAARVTDPVHVATLAGSTSSGPVTFVVTPIDADGAPGVPVTAPTVTLSGVIAAAGGAPGVTA